jgi:hypothetical protein
MADYVTFYGASRAAYNFEINPLGIAYHPRPGVYIFMRPTLGGWQALYVGETGDFNDRLNTGLQNHHRWPSVRGHNPTHIGTLHVPGATQARLNVETDLRRALNCPCNRQ